METGREGAAVLHELTERGVVPAEVRSQLDDIRTPLDRARNADPDAYRAGAIAHDPLRQDRYHCRNLAQRPLPVETLPRGGSQCTFLASTRPADPDGGRDHSVSHRCRPRSENGTVPASAPPRARAGLPEGPPEGIGLAEQTQGLRAQRPDLRSSSGSAPGRWVRVQPWSAVPSRCTCCRTSARLCRRMASWRTGAESDHQPILSSASRRADQLGRQRAAPAR